MLYDDDAQLEVRHVISLAHYVIDIYGGGEELPEGELFVKRNAIQLSPTKPFGKDTPETKSFYLFTDDCSAKEDFYHALLQCQQKHSDNVFEQAKPLRFNSKHLVKLIQQLHESEQSLETRWLNALLGRIFLAIYKTSDIEHLIRSKLARKLSRVQKPSFLGLVNIQEVDMGDCIPIFTNPKLKELTIDGTLVLETDVKYTGNFRLQVATVAKLDLGTRFKVREVNLVLAGLLKDLEGQMLLKIKPPPSNRVWITFTTMPKMNISVEPIVSSRHITYGLILRIIENRIREVVNETMVYPNWDDTPFFDTIGSKVRGGVFEENIKPSSCNVFSSVSDSKSIEKIEVENIDSKEVSNHEQGHIEDDLSSLDSTKSTGALPERFCHTRSSVSVDEVGSIDGSIVHQYKNPSSKPKLLRSRSFASSSVPVVNVDVAPVQAIKDESPKVKTDAASSIKEISTRVLLSTGASSPTSPAYTLNTFTSTDEDTPSGDIISDPRCEPISKSHSSQKSNSGRETELCSSGTISHDLSGSEATSSSPKALIKSGQERDTKPSEKLQMINQSLTAASTTAKKWGLGMLNRQQASSSPTSASAESSPGARPVSRTEPFGRGQPLPPPGTPLPFPSKTRTSKSTWPSVTLPSSPLNITGITKRKAVPLSISAADLSQQVSGSSTSVNSAPLPNRKRQTSWKSSNLSSQKSDQSHPDESLIVATPAVEEAPADTAVSSDDDDDNDDDAYSEPALENNTANDQHMQETALDKIATSSEERQNSSRTGDHESTPSPAKPQKSKSPGQRQKQSIPGRDKSSSTARKGTPTNDGTVKHTPSVKGKSSKMLAEKGSGDSLD